tara:strand:+ start:479 stop:709 length:231 start_codon:yes stop_codon:yes gene_type:complete
VDLNTIIFGGLALISLAAFFYLGKFKASKSQTERDDKIDWSKGYFFGKENIRLRSCLTIALGIFLIFFFLSYLGYN